MALQKIFHRDMMNRIIKHGDYIAWANSDYGSKIRIGVVDHMTKKKVYFILPLEDNRMTRAFPENMIVITSQVKANIEGNVGATQQPYTNGEYLNGQSR